MFQVLSSGPKPALRAFRGQPVAGDEFHLAQDAGARVRFSERADLRPRLAGLARADRSR